jgi:hypothetical protein
MTDICYIFIFLFTTTALLQRFHGSMPAIVGQSGCNRIPRTAIDTGSKRVSISFVGWIVQFSAAIIAEREIGGDEQIHFPAIITHINHKTIRQVSFIWADMVIRDNGLHRWLLYQGIIKSLHSRIGAAAVNMHAIRAITHLSVQLVLYGQFVYIRPETHALYHSCNM